MTRDQKNAEELAKELVDMQMGSIKDALTLAEDIPDPTLRTLTIIELEGMEPSDYTGSNWD